MNPEPAPPGARFATREDPTPDDAEAVERLVEATGFFSPEEVRVARELVEERLAKGLASGYRFVFATDGDRLAGYACFGEIPTTQSSFDLYWIAVDPARRRAGLGRRVLAEAERTIAALGGTRIYVDTSGRDQYAPTRAFYERAGYAKAAVLDDFFAPGDDKVIYVKVLTPAA